MKNTSKIPFKIFDALFKKMLFHITCNDVRRECLTKRAYSLQTLNMMASSKQIRISFLQQRRSGSELGTSHLSVLSIVAEDLHSLDIFSQVT